MHKAIGYTLIVVLALAVYFAVMYGLWVLWCWALPQVYAGGSQALIAPGFWLFLACWTLATMGGKAIFGGKAK